MSEGNKCIEVLRDHGHDAVPDIFEAYRAKELMYEATPKLGQAGQASVIRIGTRPECPALFSALYHSKPLSIQFTIL